MGRVGELWEAESLLLEDWHTVSVGLRTNTEVVGKEIY